MSTENQTENQEEKPPPEKTPDISGELHEFLTGLKGFSDLLSRGHWPVATVEAAQIVLRIQGAVHTLSERNIAGEWRVIVHPGGVVGSISGAESLPGAPLTSIASNWHKSAEDAFAQALRRYCDLAVGPEVKN